jgi:predicted transcriptional regulator
MRPPARALRPALLAGLVAALLCAALPAALGEGAAIASASVSLDQTALSANLHNAPTDVPVALSGTVHVNTEFGHWVHIALAVNGTGWAASITPATITRQTAADVPFSGSVSVPRAAAEGSYTLTVWAHDGDSLAPIDTQAVFTVSVFRGLLAVSADLTSPPPRPGGTAQWTITLRNVGSSELYYDLAITVPEGFTYTAYLPPEQRIPAGDKTAWVLEVQAPASAPAKSFSWSMSVTNNLEPSTPATLAAPFEVSRIVAPPAAAGQADFLATYWLAISLGMFGVGIVAYFSLTEVGYLALAFSVIVPLFTRIRRERVLDNFTRGQIYGYIQANPGAHYSAIQQVLDIENGVLAYHLRVLLRESFVVARNEGVYKRFYPRDYRIPKGRTLLTRLQVDILEKVERSPGISQREVARELAESKQVISYNVGVLRDGQLLAAERRGRDMLLRPIEGGSKALAGDDDGEAEGAPSDLASL